MPQLPRFVAFHTQPMCLPACLPVFETPVFFARGVERIKVLNQLTYVVLWRVDIVPKVVKVRMLPNNMVRAWPLQAFG